MTDAPHDAVPGESTPGPAATSADAASHDVDLDAVDLDAVERDLSAVEAALNRLADGSYWTDEVTGGPIPDDVLVRNPLARRA